MCNLKKFNMTGSTMINQIGNIAAHIACEIGCQKLQIQEVSWLAYIGILFYASDVDIKV